MSPLPDDLHKPLGQTAPESAPAAPAARGWLIGAAALALVGGAGAIVAFGDPNGGRPSAVARIETLKPPEPARGPDTTGAIVAERGPSSQTAGEVERSSGVKITRAGGGDAPSAMIIQLDQASGGVSLTPAPDRRLVEKSRFGQVPRIGADGAKPVDIYARPVVLPQKMKHDAPRIALVVGGLGLSGATTQAAFEKLPADVTFAFAPYGEDIANDARRARERGHEILLQAPMEPFDYPRNDPGPHTLRAAATPDELASDLHWLMSRMTGYIGVVNFLGAKFLGVESALAPTLRELAARGLSFLDDGAAPQSLASETAAQIGLPSARADVVLDADPRTESIEAALIKLETIARQKGVAIGFANALPASIERVARFARGLEQRGVALVPVSSMLNAGQSLSARKPGPR